MTLSNLSSVEREKEERESENETERGGRKGNRVRERAQRRFSGVSSYNDTNPKGLGPYPYNRI